MVFPFNYSFVQQPRNNPCEEQNLFIVIVVNSGVSNIERRNAIRETWGSMATGKETFWPKDHLPLPPIRLLFIVGQNNKMVNEKIQIEAEKYQDIVQGDFQDTYKNLTLKSMLGLKYLKLNCLGIRYALKCDDDTFLNLPYFVHFLVEQPLVRSFLGPLNQKSQSLRLGKWRVTQNEFPPEVYPPYVSGNAYIMTSDLVKEIYDTAKYVKPISIDDAYLTGIIPRIIGNVSYVKQDGFHFGNDLPPHVCHVTMNHMFALTDCSPSVLRRLWHEISNYSPTFC